MSGAPSLRGQVCASGGSLSTPTPRAFAICLSGSFALSELQIRSRDARTGGLDVSLFKRLVDAHPEAVVDLVYQYRMNDDIMLLSNKLIYCDRLRCGSKAVSERTLAMPNRYALNTLHTDKCRLRGCWFERLLDEEYVVRNLSCKSHDIYIQRKL
jgi:AAA domain